MLVTLILCVSMTAAYAMPRNRYALKNDFAPRNRFDSKYASYKAGVVPYLNNPDEPVAIPIDRAGFIPTLGNFNKPVAIPLDIAGFKPTFRHQDFDFPARRFYGMKQGFGMFNRNSQSYHASMNYLPYMLEREQGRSLRANRLMMAANENFLHAMNEGELKDAFIMMQYFNKNIEDNFLPSIMSDVIEQLS